MSHVIMIVDNSVAVRKIMSFALSEAGYKVEEAEDGQDALRKLKTVSPDMMFTDLKMPNMDGMELVRQVRANYRFKFMPIVVVTTEFGPLKKKEARIAGATAWISKPFKPDQVRAVAKKILG